MRHEVRREAMTLADWLATVDIAEDDKECIIRAEITEVTRRT